MCVRESLTKSEKTSTNSMFETNMERFGGSWFSITHPHYPCFYIRLSADVQSIFTIFLAIVFSEKLLVYSNVCF